MYIHASSVPTLDTFDTDIGLEFNYYTRSFNYFFTDLGYYIRIEFYPSGYLLFNAL